MSSGFMGTGSPMVTPVTGISGQLSVVWATAKARDVREKTRKRVETILARVTVKLLGTAVLGELRGQEHDFEHVVHLLYIFWLLSITHGGAARSRIGN